MMSADTRVYVVTGNYDQQTTSVERTGNAHVTCSQLIAFGYSVKPVALRVVRPSEVSLNLHLYLSRCTSRIYTEL